MNRFLNVVILENENTWSFWEIRIVLDDNTRIQTVDHVMNGDLISSEFFVAVRRDSHFLTSHKSPNVVDRLAQLESADGRILTHLVKSELSVQSVAMAH